MQSLIAENPTDQSFRLKIWIKICFNMWKDLYSAVPALAEEATDIFEIHLQWYVQQSYKYIY